ncbi:Fe3+ hydroxamate ABC transporter substrate-binding protein [Priestia megaterium]|nr:Fe3+ hydroxamate ABC transporter substrate-binding protein [Priestia megaterium]
MNQQKPICSVCKQPIKGNDVIYVRMRYPTVDWTANVRNYLHDHGTFICETCNNNEKK